MFVTIRRRTIAARRYFFYTFGAFGLGHLRRAGKIAASLLSLGGPAEILIAANAPQGREVNLPPNCSLLSLPPMTQDIFNAELNTYRSLTPGLSVENAFGRRARLIREVVDGFRPDVVFADHGPTGAERELVPLLKAIEARPRKQRPGLVLGLRDICGNVDWTMKDWHRLGAKDVLDLYDLVLVFGDEKILTTAQELNLGALLPGKVHHTGYLGRTIPAGPSGVAPSGRPMILVTAGGGNDGLPMLEAFAEFLEGSMTRSPFRFEVVTGPFLSKDALGKLQSRLLAAHHEIRVKASTKRMELLLAEAAGVVCMGGYNTTVEVASTGKPGLVLPRKNPSEEQVLRAVRMCPPAGLSYCLPEEAYVPAIGKFLDGIGDHSEANGTARIDLGGLDRTKALIASVMPGLAHP